MAIWLSCYDIVEDLKCFFLYIFTGPFDSILYTGRSIRDIFDNIIPRQPERYQVRKGRTIVRSKRTRHTDFLITDRAHVKI